MSLVMAGSDDVTLATELIKLVKMTTEGIQASQASSTEKPQEVRGGPLQMMGRLYITLVVILAAAASIGAYLDIRTTGAVSWTVWTMRVALILSAAVGMCLSVLVVYVLFKRNTMLIFSPTELSAAAQQALIPRSPEPVPMTERLLDHGAVPPVGSEEATTPIPVGVKGGGKDSGV